MGQHERLYKLKHYLDRGRCLGPARQMRELEVSRATRNRDIRHLCERHNAPIDRDAEHGGWTLLSDRRGASSLRPRTNSS